MMLDSSTSTCSTGYHLSSDWSSGDYDQIGIHSPNLLGFPNLCCMSVDTLMLVAAIIHCSSCLSTIDLSTMKLNSCDSPTEPELEKGFLSEKSCQLSTSTNSSRPSKRLGGIIGGLLLLVILVLFNLNFSLSSFILPSYNSQSKFTSSILNFVSTSGLNIHRVSPSDANFECLILIMLMYYSYLSLHSPSAWSSFYSIRAT